MTIYKPLKSEVTDKGYCITATMKQEKFSNVWDYEIHVAKDGLGVEVIPTARTTWKRKYNAVFAEYSKH